MHQFQSTLNINTYIVIIGSRKLKVLTQTAEEINLTLNTNLNSNNKVIPIELNVRKSDSISNFIKEIKTLHNINKIDYLINNAGGQFAIGSFVCMLYTAICLKLCQVVQYEN